MLTPDQRRRASLPYVLSMFSATGLSESERMETALMLQKFIIEGYMRGVNVPALMKRRQLQEGMLNIGFNDSHVPNPNAITFDRDAWRSRPSSFRVNEFFNKLGTRLSSTQTRTTPPRIVSAVRHFNERPRSGPLRTRMDKVATQVAQKVINAVSSHSLGSVFSQLGAFQAQVGITPPRVADAVRQPMPIPMPVTDQVKSLQSQFIEQNRDELARAGMDPIALQMMPARSGIASPRSMTSSPLTNAMRGSAASGRPQKAIVYTGSGTWSTEVQEIKENLAALGIQADFRSSLSGVDYSQYGAIIMPGGNASTEMAGIGGSEAQRLKQAINGGLNYLGHCAGAFLVGTWSSGLGLAPGVPGVQDTAQILKGENISFAQGSTQRQTTFYGGPTDLSVYGGKSLAQYSNGASSMQSFDYGQGHVIVTSGHPGVETGSGDSPDDDIHQQLLRAIVAGVDPGGAVPPPGSPPGTPPGTTVVGGNTTYNVQPTAVNPSAGESGGISGGKKGSRAPFRKTPVAGALPEGFTGGTTSFAAGLQGIMRGSAPMLNNLAGAIVGLK